MKQPCKHIHRDGDSCSLNNNCKYPECVEVPSAESIFSDGTGCILNILFGLFSMFIGAMIWIFVNAIV